MIERFELEAVISRIKALEVQVDTLNHVIAKLKQQLDKSGDS